MQILINVPDTLPKPLIQKRIKQLEESLKKEAEKTKQKPSCGLCWLKESLIIPFT